MSKEYQEEYKARRLVSKEKIESLYSLAPNEISDSINGLAAEGCKLVPSHPHLVKILEAFKSDSSYLNVVAEIVTAHFASDADELLEDTADKVDEAINKYDKKLS